MSRSYRWLVVPLSVLGILSLSYAKPAADAPLKGFLLVAERPRAAAPAGGAPRPAGGGGGAAAGAGAGGGAATGGGGGASEGEGIIGIIDTENNKEVGRIPEGGIISHMVAVALGQQFRVRAASTEPAA